MYQSQNPFNKEILKKFDTITDDQLMNYLEISKNTFSEWKKTSLQTRSRLLHKVAELLVERKNSYGKLITLEMGKPISQAVAEVEKCAWVCRYYADNAADFLKCRVIDNSLSQNQISYEPLGTIFAVMPWNFPFWQVFRFIAPSVMAGNVGLLKHASNVPQCALAMQEVFVDAGAPQGLFQNLFVNYKQVEQIIASPIVKAVTLTGSNYAGSKVGALAGKYTKKTVMELGGSDPFIVFDDAAMNAALENAVMSRFLNNGQSCIAAKRFILHEAIADEFLENFKSLVENFKCGDPLLADTFIGPMVNASALDEMQEQLAQTLKMGGEVLVGGKISDENPNIFEPTILINMPKDAPVWNQETFGPLAAVQVFSTEEEAIQLANDTRFGLGASLWTSDMDRAAHLAKEINSGTVAINGMVKSDPALPFGGINQSGYGRELSDYGIYEFLNIKTISYF